MIRPCVIIRTIIEKGCKMKVQGLYDNWNCGDCKHHHYNILSEPHIGYCDIAGNPFWDIDYDQLYCFNCNNQGQCKNFRPQRLIEKIVFYLFGKMIYLKCYPFLFKFHNWKYHFINVPKYRLFCLWRKIEYKLGWNYITCPKCKFKIDKYGTNEYGIINLWCPKCNCFLQDPD
jgi:hypothetical protein